MTLEQIKEEVKNHKTILILGCCGAGKSWLAAQLDPHDFFTLHCDDYLCHGEDRALWGLVEDSHTRAVQLGPCIIEGGLGYQLLLDGYKEGNYTPDLIIEVVIPPAQQRLIYLRERNPEKLKYLRYYEMQNLARLNEFFRICPPEEQPKHIIFNNIHEYATTN